MDVPLRQHHYFYQDLDSLVLILVIMDVPLRQWIETTEEEDKHVLILVIMDVPLRPQFLHLPDNQLIA